MDSILLLVPDAATGPLGDATVRRIDWLRKGSAWEAMRDSVPEFVALAPVSEMRGRFAVEAKQGGCMVLSLRGYEWLQAVQAVPGSIVALVPHVADGVAIVLPTEHWNGRLRALSPAEIVAESIRAADAFLLHATLDAEPLLTFTLPRLAPGASHRDAGIPNVSDLATAVNRPVASQTDLQGVRAGLLQIHDLLDESHEAAQSIEGEGRRAAGDYWHAIMHRREPDYGNARYWFRRVGRHPLHPDLQKFAATVLLQTAGDVAETWRTKLGVGAEWNSFGFVEMCEQAVRDEEGSLGLAARRIQWHEMLLLLKHTCEDAFGTG